MDLSLYEQVVQADARLRGHLLRTPTRRSRVLSARTGAHVYLKLENVQPTGSFKLRGALNTLLSLGGDERRAGVVAASTGNHGVAVAHGAAELGVRAVVFVPETASASRVEPIGLEGAEVRRHGAECGETEAFARSYASRQGMTYISPYNDPRVIAGQGTIGLELLEALPDLGAVYVCVGGGGLIAGIAGYLARARPGVEVIACSPERSPVMQRSVEAGRLVELPSLPTLSESSAGGLEPGAITFELCRRLVHRWLLVPEADLAPALWLMLACEHLLIEGAAAVAVAAALADASRYAGSDVVVVLCGANLSRSELLALG